MEETVKGLSDSAALSLQVVRKKQSLKDEGILDLDNEDYDVVKDKSGKFSRELKDVINHLWRSRDGTDITNLLNKVCTLSESIGAIKVRDAAELLKTCNTRLVARWTSAMRTLQTEGEAFDHEVDSYLKLWSKVLQGDSGVESDEEVILWKGPSR